MTNGNNHPPHFGTLLRKTLNTGMGAVENRVELAMLELQQEKSRLTSLLIFGLGALSLAVLFLALLTATIIFLFPAELRIYAAAGFSVLYLGGTVWAALSLKGLLKKEPFAETLRQFKKDQELLEAFK